MVYHLICREEVSQYNPLPSEIGLSGACVLCNSSRKDTRHDKLSHRSRRIRMARAACVRDLLVSDHREKLRSGEPVQSSSWPARKVSSWPARKVSLSSLSTPSLMRGKFKRTSVGTRVKQFFPHLQLWWTLSEILSRVVGSIQDRLAADSRAMDANDAVLRSAGSSASRFSSSSLSSAS